MKHKPKSGQKGPQRHAEGMHGEKTHRALLDQLESGRIRDKQQDQGDTSMRAGEHHIFEDREQHDEADKNSEKNRLNNEWKRGRLDESSPQIPEALKGSPPAGK